MRYTFEAHASTSVGSLPGAQDCTLSNVWEYLFTERKRFNPPDSGQAAKRTGPLIPPPTAICFRRLARRRAKQMFEPDPITSEAVATVAELFAAAYRRYGAANPLEAASEAVNGGLDKGGPESPHAQ